MTATMAPVPADTILPQVCTPCMAKLDARGWSRTLAVRTGALYTGVRADTAATADALDQVLGPLRAPEMDAFVQPNFSVELGEPRAGRLGLHLVYRDHEIVARRRDRDELMLDVLELLDEVPKLALTDRLVVHATAVISDKGDAVLVPGAYHKALLVRRDQLAEAGLELLRTRTQQVRAGHLLPAPYDGALSALLGGAAAEGRRTVGEYPVRVWSVPAVGDQVFPLAPAQGVFTAFAMVLNRGTMGAGATLRAVADATGGCQFVAVPELSPSALAQAITSLARTC